MRVVVLVGYRGTGKSTVAALVAEKLGLTVFGTDAEIVRRAGKPIPEYVAEKGWPAFRDLEEEVCRDAVAEDGRLIDCGGGVVERENNHAVLRGAGRVFWLTARPDTIVSRIQGSSERPSLTGSKSFTDEVVEVLERRTPLYRAISHHEVETDQRTPDDVARAIVALVIHDTPEAP